MTACCCYVVACMLLPLSSKAVGLVLKGGLLLCFSHAAWPCWSLLDQCHVGTCFMLRQYVTFGTLGTPFLDKCCMDADAEFPAGSTESSPNPGRTEAGDFVWYGQTYKCQDLHEAYAMLADSTDNNYSAIDAHQPGTSSRRQSKDPWQSPNWKSMSKDAQL